VFDHLVCPGSDVRNGGNVVRTNGRIAAGLLVLYLRTRLPWIILPVGLDGVVRAWMAAPTSPGPLSRDGSQGLCAFPRERWTERPGSAPPSSGRAAPDATIDRDVERLREVLATGTPNAQPAFLRTWITRIEADGMKLTVTFTLPAELGGSSANTGENSGRTKVLPRVANGGGGGSRTRVRSNIQRSRYVTFRIPCGGCRDLWSPSRRPV